MIKYVGYILYYYIILYIYIYIYIYTYIYVYIYEYVYVCIQYIHMPTALQIMATANNDHCELWLFHKIFFTIIIIS